MDVWGSTRGEVSLNMWKVRRRARPEVPFMGTPRKGGLGLDP